MFGARRVRFDYKEFGAAQQRSVFDDEARFRWDDVGVLGENTLRKGPVSAGLRRQFNEPVWRDFGFLGADNGVEFHTHRLLALPLREEICS